MTHSYPLHVEDVMYPSIALGYIFHHGRNLSLRFVIMFVLYVVDLLTYRTHNMYEHQFSDSLLIPPCYTHTQTLQHKRAPSHSHFCSLSKYMYVCLCALMCLLFSYCYVMLFLVVTYNMLSKLNWKSQLCAQKESCSDTVAYGICISLHFSRLTSK